MKLSPLCLLIVGWYSASAQLPGAFGKNADQNTRSTYLTTKFLTPVRIIWKSDETGTFILNEERILNPGNGQADLRHGEYFTLRNDSISRHGVVLDFGKEIQGGIEIVATRGNKNPAGTIRVRFGESVSEAMSEIGERGATNDHAIRDFRILVPKLGRVTVGESGFRFVRIDLEDLNTSLLIKEINAVFRYRDIPYLGSFASDDKRLNDIWMTGAYTVHLNMQDYLWDGVKRDRLVWVGDMHPEVMTINAVFGFNEVVPKSLDFARDITPIPDYMNGISSYSIWWILIQRDWYNYQGNMEYLKEQHSYLTALLHHLSNKIGDDGSEMLDGERFLDWPSSENPGAIHAGLHALMVMAFEAGAELSQILGDGATATLCRSSVEKLKMHIPDLADSKQAAALLALAGLIASDEAHDNVLGRRGVKDMSTFFGYYILNALAQAGDYQGAIDTIREYWGAMLDLGATSFWEDFNIEWLNNAARIDELVPEGKIDVHGTFGDYVYKGFRHSLCHGWASGPTAWLTQYVLGINIVEPGARQIEIVPHLGDLEWVEGTFPTPYGILRVRHEKNRDGSIHTTFVKPPGIVVVVK